MSRDEPSGQPRDVLGRALDAQDWRACRTVAKALEEEPDDRAAEALLRLAHVAAPAGATDNDRDDLAEAQTLAVLALGRMRRPEAVGPFLRIVEEVLADHASDKLMLSWYVIEALGAIGDPRAVGPLTRALAHADVEVTKSAQAALARLGGPAVPPLLDILRDSPSVPAIRALASSGDPRAIEPLIGLLRRDDVSEYIRGEAAWTLGTLRATRTFDLLLVRFTDPGETSYVRRLAARGLGLLAERRAFDPLVAALTSPDWGIRADAARGLGHLGDSQATTPLARLLEDAEDEVCMDAARALAEIGDAGALPALLAAQAAAAGRLHSALVERTIAAALATIRRH